ncbi:TetR/AcrR family transcriptional regulator C-terminal domain-containing protein [Mycolicibacterium aichiense]|uniref:TetR family transcriptional regulator n=2 Tax=Mycolicibacterium aichiense TaxID=1799 RepID=A0AAD1HJH4_9MYCO|nr:TetR/AcrR family transcriptional regulator C-terminal domain-containing protein [Mycolicibacterium aichiense]BBX05243.1 TetR family transcriptional regulator [Mycolicibacterium aichiense]
MQESAAPRQRGRPRQITRERIVSAARSMPFDELTMQAVADVLGVDPKALNYHVGDREALRELVAVDAFAVELSRIDMPVGGDWRDVLRRYATALRDATVTLGELVTYFRLPASGIGALEPVERVLQVLVEAGFSVADAGHILRLVSELGHAAGREAVFLSRSREHPYVADVAAALNTAAAEHFPLLREVVALRDAAPDDGQQLDFNLDVLITGLAATLSQQ